MKNKIIVLQFFLFFNSVGVFAQKDILYKMFESKITISIPKNFKPVSEGARNSLFGGAQYAFSNNKKEETVIAILLTDIFANEIILSGYLEETIANTKNQSTDFSLIEKGNLLLSQRKIVFFRYSFNEKYENCTYTTYFENKLLNIMIAYPRKDKKWKNTENKIIKSINF